MCYQKMYYIVNFVLADSSVILSLEGIEKSDEGRVSEIEGCVLELCGL